MVAEHGGLYLSRAFSCVLFRSGMLCSEFKKSDGFVMFPEFKGNRDILAIPAMFFTSRGVKLAEMSLNHVARVRLTREEYSDFFLKYFCATANNPC